MFIKNECFLKDFLNNALYKILTPWKWKAPLLRVLFIIGGIWAMDIIVLCTVQCIAELIAGIEYLSP